MKKIFNIADYPGKYVMHCDTQEKAGVFCNYLNSVGRRWRSGDSYTPCTEWGNKENTDNEIFYFFNRGVRIFSKDYAIEHEYTILEFDDFQFLPSSVKASSLVGQAYGLPKVKDVIFNAPATIVFWTDGTKTVVKCDKCTVKHKYNCTKLCGGNLSWCESGLSCAFAKKAFGKEYFEAVKKYCE